MPRPESNRRHAPATHAVFAGLLALVALTASAAPGFTDLPPTPVAVAALEGASMVRIARSGIGIEEAQRQRLAAGPYEFVARAGLARRHDPIRLYRDSELALERPLRSGEKAALDRRIGESGVQVARLSLVDARHEAGRMLLRMWFAHLRAIEERAVWATQLTVLRRQLEAVNGRVRAGDAPRSDLLLAEAALAQAEQGAGQADARIELTRVELSSAFPDLPLANLPPIAQPALPEDDESVWRTRVLEHNHELQIAQAQREQAALVASRTRADRIPDPTLGVRYFSERSGTDRVVGLTLSIPLPGAARDAALQAALAQVDQRAEREAAVARRIGGEASAVYRAARSSFETWGKAELAARRIGQHADLAARAYALGEGTLTEVLIARRSANESRLVALAAQAESQEARYRLILDAHRLWPFDDEDNSAIDGSAAGSGAPAESGAGSSGAGSSSGAAPISPPAPSR